VGIGTIYLVGAGPGASDLMTVRGLRLLRQADLVICDALLPHRLLEELGISTRNKSVMQLQAGETRHGQRQVLELMRRAASDGKTVVRLKGGDPLVFGRASEELEFFCQHGIPWEIVPGPSVSTAALSSAGLPITWRKQGRSFAVVTARLAGGELNRSLPRVETLVVFMGVAVLEGVVQQMLQDGWKPDTAAALLERVTMPWERRLRGPLCRMPAIARAAGVSAPAILVAGAAALRREAFRLRPTILFTGLDPTNFRRLGAVLHWPALIVVRDEAGVQAVPQAVSKLQNRQFELVIFTSRAGVRSFFRALNEQGLDARLLAGARIVAAGSGTDAELLQQGLRADAVAQQPGSAGILRAIGPSAGGQTLLVQGSHAPQDLEHEMRKRGLRVLRLALHKVLTHPELGKALPEHDVIYFTSPSGVRAYWKLYGSAAFKTEVWCIGEATLKEVERLGYSGKVVNPNVS